MSLHFLLLESVCVQLSCWRSEYFTNSKQIWSSMFIRSWKKPTCSLEDHWTGEGRRSGHSSSCHIKPSWMDTVPTSLNCFPQWWPGPVQPSASSGESALKCSNGPSLILGLHVHAMWKYPRLNNSHFAEWISDQVDDSANNRSQQSYHLQCTCASSVQHKVEGNES